MPHRRIVLPLDVGTAKEAMALATPLRDHVGVFKIGLELFTAEGPSVVREVATLGLPIFLDLKLHDIPETVERAVAAAASLGVKFLSVHASGGAAMLTRAVKQAEGSSAGAMTILAVTVLTSVDRDTLAAIGVDRDVGVQVDRLVDLANKAGVRGFVCSPHEAVRVRARAAAGTFIVVPGVRPKGAAHGDQARVATPAEAIRNGADLIVVGRPIRDAEDRVAAAQAIAAEIAGAGRVTA